MEDLLPDPPLSNAEAAIGMELVLPTFGTVWWPGGFAVVAEVGDSVPGDEARSPSKDCVERRADFRSSKEGKRASMCRIKSLNTFFKENEKEKWLGELMRG